MTDKDLQLIESQLSSIEPLAQGGQKKVFSAFHSRFGKVAFKKISNLNGKSKKRIEREIHILNEVNHPAFPKIFLSAFSTDSTKCIIIEQFIEAKTLSEVNEIFFPPSDALTFLKHLVCILSTIWDINLVHRDLKPDNIMISEDNEIFIIDFGCARDLDDKTITTVGRAPFTYRYAAPEQIRYEKSKISFRTDQFALGIIIGELIYRGNHPFGFELTNEEDMVNAILTNNWYRDGIRKHQYLYNLIDRLLSIEPHSRFRTTEQLLSYIDLAIGDFL